MIVQSTANCRTDDDQPSRIPGNIGTLNSEVIIWDHDPFWARATQMNSWLFSNLIIEQQQENIRDMIFEAGGALLKPVYKLHDMFICTVNPQIASEAETEGPDDPGETTANAGVDFVGSTASGVGEVARSKMPGGQIFECNGQNNPGADPPCENIDSTTGKDMFSHQVWRYIGSLMNPLVPIHPSEYSLLYSEIQNKDILQEGEFHSAPRFDYQEEIEDGKKYIMPYQTTKHSSGASHSTHWTLEKWTPLWQGEDFSITIKIHKNTNDAVDPNDGSVISTKIEPYKYLMHDFPSELPSQTPLGFVDGISNEAFYVRPQQDKQGNVSAEELSKSRKAAREAFDWRYKTYILVEVGVNNVDHRYFIELVKGRYPRFLHLGDEWDNANRLKSGVNTDPNDQQAGFSFMRKCRELSVFYDIVCNELFRKKDFRFTVRNHLGRIIITFEGHEDTPWVITRHDNDPTSVNFDKKLVPMVIPAAPARIHGGNISCGVNFTPLQFMPSATIKFDNRQVDSKQATNNDVYLTFSHMGQSVIYHNPKVVKEHFDDKRFAHSRMGYNCDAYVVSEIIKNATQDIRIYEEYSQQYRLYGKGWLLETPRTEEEWITEKDPDTLLPLPPTSKNGMIETANGNVKGTPSRLEIFNARDPILPFPLELNEQTNSTYPYPDCAAVWDVGVRLSAGSMAVNPPSGPDALPIPNDGLQAALFENSVTPIVTSWQLILLGGGKPFGSRFSGDSYSEDSPNVESFDISPLVQKITDSWTSEDFFSIKHEMQLECYIPIESTSADDPQNSTTEDVNLFALGRKLLALHDKAFYPTVSYWWDTGVGHRGVIGNSLNRPSDNPQGNDMLIQMTGVAYGAQLQRSNNLLVMKFTIKDYMSILENQRIFNSPFFDAVQDVKAVYELGKMAGFDNSPGRSVGIDRRPLGYLQKVLDDGNFIGERKFLFNGEESRCERYDLPGSYATLAEPSIKFQNGETYESAMKKISQLSGKALYFDRWGVLRLETMPSISAAFSSANEDIVFTPVFDFVSTPIARSSSIPDPDEDDNSFTFNAQRHAAHLVYNALTYERSVEDCVNQIVVLSASNDIKLADGSSTGGFIVEGYTFFEQIWDPESEGFLGYRKPFYQANGVFGGIEGVRSGVSQYAKMKHPPVIMSFETYGVPGIKALDIISLDGNLAYVTEITHDLDSSTNRWWMQITAEWLKPFKGELGFLKAHEPSTIGLP